MSTPSRPPTSAFAAALFAAIYTAWAAELGFRISSIWVLITAAAAATATAYAVTLAAWGSRRLRNHAPRRMARQ